MTTVTETFIPPSSSSVAAATYEPDVQNLTIEFTTGATYVYYNVPQSVYRSLTMSASAGQFVKRYLVGRYAYEKQ